MVVISIANRMVGSSIDPHRIFEVPFFSIIVEEILKGIMADEAALETNDLLTTLAPSNRTHIIVDIAIATTSRTRDHAPTTTECFHRRASEDYSRSRADAAAR